MVAGYCFIILQYIFLISGLSSSTTNTLCFFTPCCLQQNSKCCYCIHCPVSSFHLLKAYSLMYIQQFDNLIHLVLPVHYASSCHATFSRIQSVVIVFIVLSQVFICLKPTVQCIFNSLTILLEFVLNCINPKYSDTKTSTFNQSIRCVKYIYTWRHVWE